MILRISWGSFPNSRLSRQEIKIKAKHQNRSKKLKFARFSNIISYKRANLVYDVCNAKVMRTD